MAVVPQGRRLAELRRLGLSEALVRLSAGEVLDEVFLDRCVGPPFYVDHGAGTPDGPPLVPLWDHNDMVCGVWERPDGPEFVEFGIEAPEEPTSLARTEQEFWTTQFDSLYECDTPLEQLRTAAAIAGFRFLARYLSAREAAGDRLDTFEGHGTWLRQLVAEIDRESGGPS